MDDSRSSLSRLHPEAVTKSLTPSPDGSRQRRVMPATPSSRDASNTSSRIWCSEKIPHQKKKVLGGELFTESSSKINENENILVPAFMGYDQEMVPKTKDLVERLNLDIKLLNFNTGRILVPESQAVNESLESTRILNTPELSKDSEAESLTPLPPLKNL
nr:hypothetical protein [Tanacetum cinerariifolium]